MKDYKKILEGVVNIINTTEKSDIGFANICTYIGENCSELAVSEDEKVRKELLLDIPKVFSHDKAFRYIAWLEKQNQTFTKKDVDDAYLEGMRVAKHELEKQSEQKPTKNIVETWKEMRLEVYQQASGNRHEPNCSDDTTKMFSLNDIDEIIEKMSEQKPTNKPRFKAGDWIIRELDNTYYQIKKCILNVTTNKYGYDLTSGGYISSQDANFYHLWTIQDAKDGDVLYMDNGLSTCTFIYKSINNVIIQKYASYNKFGFEGTTYLVLNDGYVCPATKEQRDLLFSKMKEASYEWDAKNKQLLNLSNVERTGKNCKELTEFEKEVGIVCRSLLLSNTTPVGYETENVAKRLLSLARKQIADDIVKQYADKGEKNYQDDINDVYEDEMASSYWDGFRDCANGILKELKDE